MANGDLISIDQHRWAIKLLDAAQNAVEGPWVEVPAWYNIRSFHVGLTVTTTTDTINIEVHNAISTPTATTNAGGVISKTFTGTTLAGTVVESYRWMRAVKTGSTNTATVILEAARNE